MSEKEITSILKDNEEDKVERICAILREHKITIQDALIDFVAALCDVNKHDMVNVVGKGNAHLTQARWFFWYANRMLLGATYNEMSEDSAKIGTHVTKHGIMLGVLRMATMTEQEPIWRKRWMIMKRIIKESENNSIDKADNQPIKIVVPKDIEIEIQKK